MKTQHGQLSAGFGCLMLLVAVVLICAVIFVGQPGNICFPLPCGNTRTSGPTYMRLDEGIGMIVALPCAMLAGAIALGIWFGMRKSRWN
jgi:hypothetical protein